VARASAIAEAGLTAPLQRRAFIGYLALNGAYNAAALAANPVRFFEAHVTAPQRVERVRQLSPAVV
jgi:hypothetical protein